MKEKKRFNFSHIKHMGIYLLFQKIVEFSEFVHFFVTQYIIIVIDLSNSQLY